MKKIILIVMTLIIFITVGCKNKEKKEEIVANKYNLSGLVIKYESASVMVYNAPSYEIKLYADKYITYGYSGEDIVKRVDLTDKEYNKIINYAFSEKIMGLRGNLTDPNVLDGNHSRITLYENGKEVYSNGGDNVSNRRYNKLVRLLRDKE